MKKEVFITFFLVLLGVASIFYSPLIIIWSINNLFNLETPYNWKTWVSVVVLLTTANLIVRDNENKKNKPFWR